jgi:hypothetical protein
MSEVHDGPRTTPFSPLSFQGNVALSGLGEAGISPEMAGVVALVPGGACTGWGIAFQIGDGILAAGLPGCGGDTAGRKGL